MSFDWSEYLTLAQELAGELVLSNEEAKSRSAISRAYFSAYCIARNFLRDKEGYRIPEDSDAHSLVRDLFVKSYVGHRRRIGQNLERLRLDRNKADYDDIFTGLPSSVTVALNLAKWVISTLSTL
jgi:uncharacterized protein (UPF0332 family)